MKTCLGFALTACFLCAAGSVQAQYRSTGSASLLPVPQTRVPPGYASGRAAPASLAAAPGFYAPYWRQPAGYGGPAEAAASARARSAAQATVPRLSPNGRAWQAAPYAPTRQPARYAAGAPRAATRQRVAAAGYYPIRAAARPRTATAGASAPGVTRTAYAPSPGLASPAPPVAPYPAPPAYAYSEPAPQPAPAEVYGHDAGYDSVSYMVESGTPLFCRSPGDMTQHFPYCPPAHGYYYFRPYHFAHVWQHQQLAASLVGDPRNPYDNLVFQRIYEELGPAPEEIPPPAYEDYPTF